MDENVQKSNEEKSMLDELIQFCIMLIGLISLICMIFFHTHKRK